MALRAQGSTGAAGTLRRAWDLADDRFGFSALAYPVPRHANALVYTLGGVTLGAFLLLVATGIYLAQLYDPTPAAAHSSIVDISGHTVGSLVRSLHFWLSTIFIVTLALHLLRTFVTAAYKAPREGIWLTGIGLFLLAGGLLFTGTILKWDQEAQEAFGHNVEIAELLGIFGFWFSPEFTDSVSLLIRTYVAHVSILPLLLGGLVGVHLLLVKRLKVSPLASGTPEEIDRRAREEPQLAFTTHLARIAYWTLVVLGIALVLAAVRPAGIGPEGVEGIEITKPPWYFLWLYPLENWFGLDSLVAAPAILVVGLALLPFLDRNRERDPRRRSPWIALGALVILAWAALTIYGYFTVPVSHVEEMG